MNVVPFATVSGADWSIGGSRVGKSWQFTCAHARRGRYDYVIHDRLSLFSFASRILETGIEVMATETLVTGSESKFIRVLLVARKC